MTSDPPLADFLYRSNAMKEIIVDLGDRSYPIYIGCETLSTFGEICKTSDIPNRVVIVTDTNVARLYLRPLSNALHHTGFHVDAIVIPHGEEQKTLRRANAVITKLLHLGAGREYTLVALGGGVIGDLTGFVAATFRRGITFVQCPTTLLSQVDSSIGGKGGVNHPLAKNAIGTFYQPRFVFSDFNLLRTLPKREIISGLGEILKYGIIIGEEMFAFLQIHLHDIQVLDLDVIQETAVRCISLKAKLVSEDEREIETEGGRAVLNIGHAVGQTLETLSNYKLRHGEAVLLGLRIETVVAKELGILSERDFKKIYDFLQRVDFRFSLGRGQGGGRLFSREKLLRLLAKNKFVLPAGIGKVAFRNQIPEPVLQKALTEFM